MDLKGGGRGRVIERRILEMLPSQGQCSIVNMAQQIHPENQPDHLKNRR